MKKNIAISKKFKKSKIQRGGFTRKPLKNKRYKHKRKIIGGTHNKEPKILSLEQTKKEKSKYIVNPVTKMYNPEDRERLIKKGVRLSKRRTLN